MFRPHVSVIACVSFVVVGALFTQEISAQAPINDNFANRTSISSLPASISGSNVNATKESGEPNHAFNPGGRSVWYSFTAASNSQILVSTEGSNFDTVLAIYTGSSITGLTEIKFADDFFSTDSRLTFQATSGTTYHIAVDGFSGASGVVKLTVAVVTPPSNDNFANRQTINPALPQTITGTNIGATKESFEDNFFNGGVSVWYTFTPTVTGTVKVDTEGTNFDSLLTIYTGTAPSLSQIGFSDFVGTGNERIIFSAQAGTPYQICVDGYAGNIGTIKLNLNAVQSPPNDNFSARIPIMNLPATINASNEGATKESGEPDHDNFQGGASIWYSFTPPQNGIFLLSTANSEFFGTLLAVYTGNSVNSLTPVTSSAFQNPLVLQAVGGTQYQIAIDGIGFGTGSETGKITLAIEALTPPPNDNFVDAATLTGKLAVAAGTNKGATAETGEPVHGAIFSSTKITSVWWKWTSPATVTEPFSISTLGSDFDTVLAVYTGNPVNNLALIASNDNSGFDITSEVFFFPAPSTTYYIAVDGYNGRFGNILLRLEEIIAPPNDDFADALSLTSLPVKTEGSNRGATLETNETTQISPPHASTIWYKIAPAGSQQVVISTTGSEIFTRIVVYEQSVDFNAVPFADSDSGNVIINADGISNYFISIGSQFSGQTGLIRLAISSPPPNDDFVDRLPIPNSTANSKNTVTGNNIVATHENADSEFALGHAPLSSHRSLWWRWTPILSGPVLIDTIGSDFTTILAVYKGASLPNLIPVALDNAGSAGNRRSKVFFQAMAGVEYQIVVDGFNGESGNIKLNVTFPGNDDFANAVKLTQFTPPNAPILSFNSSASLEPGEPNHAELSGFFGGKSAWWSITPTIKCKIVVDTFGSSFNTLLAVYSGSSLHGLTLVAKNDNAFGFSSLLTSLVNFNASADTTYYIAVDGFFGASGLIKLNVRPAIAGTITTLSPTGTTVIQNPSSSGTPVPLTVNGTGFNPQMAIRFNGMVLDTTFVSSTQLQANIGQDLLGTAGVAQVDVLTQTPDGGESEKVEFKIYNSTTTGVWLVTTKNDNTSLGSLRFAMSVATSGDKIQFDAAGAFSPSNQLIDNQIELADALPVMVETNVTIDGSNARVLITGQPVFDGFTIQADNCVLKGLALNNFKNAIVLNGNGQSASNCSIGGKRSLNEGLILYSNANFGIDITGDQASANTVKGSIIGMDNNFSLKGNQGGIRIQSGANNNVIGSNEIDECNIIGGNSSVGINISGLGTTGNRVIGNCIGILPQDVIPSLILRTGYKGRITSSFISRPNSVGASVSSQAKNNVLGGSSSGESNSIQNNEQDGVLIANVGTKGISLQRNVIAGNGSGIRLSEGGNAGLSAPNVSISSGPQLFTENGKQMFELVLVGSAAEDGATIEIFTDDTSTANSSDPQASAFVTDASVNSDLTWTATVRFEASATIRALTVTQTTSDGSTSSFGTVTFEASSVIPPNQLDSDGDGFTDEFELAFGSDKDDPDSTPTGTAKPDNPTTLSLDRVSVRLNFAQSDRDKISLKGRVELSQDLTELNGLKAALNFGGVIAAGTLNERLSLSDNALKYSKPKNSVAKFSARFAGNLQSKLTDEGMTSSNQETSLQVPVMMVLGTAVYYSDRTVTYRLKAGQSGTAK